MSDFPELSGADFSGISQRGTLVVGFSGGADSTVLLHCLLEAAGSRDRIVLAHVNHGLRGAEADRDEAFCREQGRKAGRPLCLPAHGCEGLGSAGRRERGSLRQRGALPLF